MSQLLISIVPWNNASYFKIKYWSKMGSLGDIGLNIPFGAHIYCSTLLYLIVGVHLTTPYTILVQTWPDYIEFVVSQGIHNLWDYTTFLSCVGVFCLFKNQGHWREKIYCSFLLYLIAGVHLYMVTQHSWVVLGPFAFSRIKGTEEKKYIVAFFFILLQGCISIWSHNILELCWGLLPFQESRALKRKNIL